MNTGPVSTFIKHHYRHFNAAALIDAAEGYRTLVDNGGIMMMTLAGAMSTAVRSTRSPARARIWKRIFSISSRTTCITACRITAI
jgi:hypothetical protein